MGTRAPGMPHPGPLWVVVTRVYDSDARWQGMQRAQSPATFGILGETRRLTARDAWPAKCNDTLVPGLDVPVLTHLKTAGGNTCQPAKLPVP